jgi:hypothetical protein
VDLQTLEGLLDPGLEGLGRKAPGILAVLTDDVPAQALPGGAALGEDAGDALVQHLRGALGGDGATGVGGGLEKRRATLAVEGRGVAQDARDLSRGRLPAGLEGGAQPARELASPLDRATLRLLEGPPLGLLGRSKRRLLRVDARQRALLGGTPTSRGCTQYG